ncbi:hypothetical protein ACFW3D_15910 [Streptomyces sp. NPDC058864]
MGDADLSVDGDTVVVRLRDPLRHALLELADLLVADAAPVHNGPESVVELTEEAIGDPLRRWEADSAAQSIRDRLADRIAAADAVVRDALTAPGPVRVRLRPEAAELWLEWLNRLYLAVRARELGPLKVGGGQRLDVRGSGLREPGAHLPEDFGPAGAAVGRLLTRLMDTLDERNRGR